MADDVFHLLRFYILLEFHNLQFFSLPLLIRVLSKMEYI